MGVSFTESEMLILSSLAYADTGKIKGCFDGNGNPIGDPPQSVNVLLPELEKLAKGTDYDKAVFSNGLQKEQYSQAVESLKKKLTENDFVISKSINHNGTNESGFSAFAIEPRDNPDKEVVVCCRGSDGFKFNGLGDNTLNDWVGADAAVAWPEQTAQQDEMEKFMSDLAEYKEIDIVGHSLGGNLAMYAAITYFCPENIRGVYSFDGPGFNTAFILGHHDETEQLKARLHNFQNEHDFVSSSLLSVGRVMILESALETDDQLINHNRWAISVNADGTLAKNSTGEKDAVCQAWTAVSTTVSNSIIIADVIVGPITYYATSFCKLVLGQISSFLASHQAASHAAASAAYFRVNTALLRSYADRLTKVNQRIVSLDRRMDALYTKVGLQDLWNLLSADIMTGYNWHITNCARYLTETADDFDTVERNIAANF